MSSNDVREDSVPVEQAGKKSKSAFREYAESIVFALLLALFIRSPFWDSYLFHFKEPQRGDVVVFIFPEDRTKDFIKRVIGIEGDMIEIRNKKIYVNGKPLEDPHAHFEGDPPERGIMNIRDDYGPRRVPENH